MLKIENLSYGYPQKDLFNKISFTLESGQHCAFIGTSGSGKSTLIKLIMDPENYMFDGLMETDTSARIAYISQFPSHERFDEITVFEYIAESHHRLEHKLDEIGTLMASATDIDPLLEKYQEVSDAFEAIGGHDYESIIMKTLNLADLGKLKDMPLAKISGGEFKLIQVIKEMLIEPNLMIMDEPDVFLDFENLNALRTLINAYKGTLLVITHNRYLLNHCFNKIIHLENMELQEFEGDYVDYNFNLLLKKIELQELAAADTEEIERNEALIRNLRMIASSNSEASRGKALYARVKIQERLEARRIKAPFVDVPIPKIQFTDPSPLSDTNIVTVSDFNFGYDLPLLKNVSFEIGKTDKVALIGTNGTGKTTLFREIYHNSSSSIDIPSEASIAYLSQDQSETLDEQQTIKECFFDLGFKTLREIQVYLLNYGFNDSILDRKIGSLSGGERNLIQLAVVALSPSHLLMMDEPTSHLDTYSQLALERAINTYNGAVLMVSHDYYTIANCMDYVLLIENKTIRKMSIRKFRKMIYSNHFSKDYLEMELKKKEIETNIELALRDSNFELAKTFTDALEKTIRHLHTINMV